MRTLFVRSLQSVLAIATVALLTGANDAGCGLGTVIGGSSSSSSGTGTTPVEPSQPILCPPGLVAQLVCDPSTSGGGGEIIPVEICDGADCPPPPPPCDPADPNCSSPDPGTDDSPPMCDPADPNCVPPTPCDPADPACTTPPPPPPVCDPADANCVPPFPPPGCSFECVPEGQICPPGTDLVTVCTGSDGDEGGGGADPGTPDAPDQPVSNGMCWTECAPHGCGGVDVPSAPPMPD